MKNIILGLSALIFSYTATAATILVTNTNDSGAGSLRTAMQSTAQNGDIIRFAPSLISSGSATITFLTPMYTRKDITIVGLYNSTDTLFLSGGTTQQLFYINHLSSTGVSKSLTLDSLVMIDASATRGGHIYFTGNDLTIKNSIFRNGQKSSGTTLEGGSISITDMSGGVSDLTILNSKFYNNKAQTGGAIFSRSIQTVTITNSQFYSNEGTTHGGGIVIFDPSNVTVLNSTFNDNTTAGNGGGLYCTRFSTGYSPVVNLNVTSSSFYDNTANSGAGIQVLNVTPTVNIKTSTFNYNIAAAGGGGIDVGWDGNNSSTTNVTIENSTITKNYNTSAYNLGSGIYIENSYYQTNEFLTLKGSIIADNGTNAAGRNIRFDGAYNNGGSGFTSNGHNLLGEPSIPLSTFHPTDVASVSGAQLNLGLIQDNGGFTPTRLPGIGSIAINKGDTLDLSAAQNGPITDGFRDAGAAEFVCIIQQSISPSACASYISPSGNYTWTTNGTYADTTTGNGCDTIFTINLSINNSTATFNQTACDSYTSPSGKIWTTSNTYLDTIANAVGCDSVMTINLTINQTTSDFITLTTCNSYTSPSGKIWTLSSIYNDTIPNSNGCDSVITFNLTVNQPTASSINSNACRSYTSPSGKIWTVSNVYNDTIANSAGCDSIITINLTMYESYASFTVNSCGDYTSPSGKVITTSGVIMDTIMNYAFCDSVMTITVSVTNNSNVINVNGITLSAAENGATYKWLDCSNSFAFINGETSQSYTPSANGSYAVEITKNSCVDTSACTQIASVGIAEKSKISIYIYPNPTSSILNIDPKGERILSLKVFTVSGQLINSKINGTNKVDVSQYKSGLYILQIETQNGIALSRFIKK